MLVLSVGEIKYMITLHKKNILQFFLYDILDWEIFQAIWENLEEIRIGTGAGALRIGKSSDKTRILGNSSFQ